MNKSFHVCPVHGLFGQGKQGNKYGYIETLKEIRKFKGNDGGEGGIRKISRGYIENMGGRKKEKKYEYIQEKINNIKEENEKEVDNYKFYESRNLSKKKVNNSLNIVNSENNMTGSGNIIGERTRSGIGLSQKMKSLQLMQSMHSKQGKQSMQSMGMGMQGSKGMKESQGSEYSKVYIATMITPVYSNSFNQQRCLNLSGRRICGVCGGNYRGLGKMTSNSQGVVKSCPIHRFNI